MKILLHSVAPWAPTGYGQQVGLFAPRLAQHHDVAISTIYGLQGARMTFDGIEIYPSAGGTYGEEGVQAHADSHFGGDRADGLVITLLDVPALSPAAWQGLQVASWTPVDHDPLAAIVGAWFTATGAIPIAMSRYGEQQLAEFDPVYVPHGVDTTTYAPKDKAESRGLLGLPEDAFVAGVVAVNSGDPSRKSFPQILEAFARLRARHSDALLFLHTDLTGGPEDIYLPSLIEALGLDDGSVLACDQYRYRFDPLLAGDMAHVYSAFDVLVNPSMGEGFGLPVLEAQACGVPAIVTDFSAMSEVCGAGWKVGYERFWTPAAAWQALPSVAEIDDALELAYGLTADERGGLAQTARSHALGYDADRVTAGHWLPALNEIASRLAGPTSTE